MKLKEPKNRNYCATVVEIKTLVALLNCDNVQAAIIMGNQVVVGKDVKVGDIGLFFPVETALSDAYLKANNLYRKAELNSDPLKKGYFEENGRIRCVKFRQNKSEGLFMPIDSVATIIEEYKSFFSIGDEFDELNGIEICRKYISRKSNTPGNPSSKNANRRLKRFKSKLVDNQFRFHIDTALLYKNLHRILPDSLLSITYKLHGTSGISSYVLCKKHLSVIDRIGGFFHNIYTNICSLGRKSFQLIDTVYDYIYSSRKVIKNEDINPNVVHYYDTDIWKIADEQVKPFLQKGMTA